MSRGFWAVRVERSGNRLGTDSAASSPVKGRRRHVPEGRVATPFPPSASDRFRPLRLILPTQDAVALSVVLNGQGIGNILKMAYIVLVISLLAIGRSYRPRLAERPLAEAPGLAARIAAPAVAFASLMPGDPAVSALLHRVPVTIGSVVALRLALHRLLGFVRARGMLLEPTLILGSGEVGVRIANDLLAHPERGLVPVGFLDRLLGSQLPLPVLGDIDAFDQVVGEFEIHRVIIAFGGHGDATMVPILRSCRVAHVAVHAVPRFFEFDSVSRYAATDEVSDIPVVHVSRRSLRFSGHQIMRGLTPAQPSWDSLGRRLPGKVSVVIPAMNEGANITWVLERVPDFVDEVVLVDGNSDDDTVDRAKSACSRLRVVSQPRLGKGAALRAGFAEARGDYIVMLDADGSMDPAEIGNYLDPLLHGYEFVKGSRRIAGGASDDLTTIRRAGNFVLTTCVNGLFGARFTDLCYGFSAFRRDCLESLDLRRDGFEIETEMTLRAVKAGLRIAEVPSHERARRFGQSNLHTFRDGQRVLRTLLAERITPTSMPRVPLSRRTHLLPDSALDRLSA